MAQTAVPDINPEVLQYLFSCQFAPFHSRKYDIIGQGRSLVTSPRPSFDRVGSS